MARPLVVRAFAGCLLAAVLLGGCGAKTTTVIERVTVPRGETTTGASAQVIELYHGIGGVSVGMSMDQVKQRLGEPASSSQESHPIAGAITRDDYPGGLSVSFAAGKVISVATTSNTARTAGGVGVGSSEQEVRRLPSVSCETLGGQYGCRVGQALPGGIVNSFTIVDGRVSRVMIARVID